MANIKLTSHNWETSGIYDLDKAKTQRLINAELYNKVLRTTGSIDLPAAGVTETHYLPGLTLNHEIVAWHIMISGVVQPENASPVSLTVETFNASGGNPGYFTVTNDGATVTGAAFRPIFALPTTVNEATVT